MAPSPNALAAERHRQMVERRRQVAALRLAGVRDQGVIAARLGVTQPTISKDFAALNAKWEAESAQDVGAAKGQDLERLEELLLAVWQEAKRGDLDAVARALDVLKRRAGILGYDAPKRVENTGRDGGPPEERITRIIVEQAPPRRMLTDAVDEVIDAEVRTVPTAEREP